MKEFDNDPRVKEGHIVKQELVVVVDLIIYVKIKANLKRL